MSFSFTPTTGLLDTNVYPTNPVSETAARQQFMDLFNQLKDYLNTSFAGSLTSTGYKKMPDGLIIQWGTGNYSSNDARNGMIAVDVPFPITYPNALVYFNVFESLNNADEEKFSHVSIQNYAEGALDRQNVKWRVDSAGAWTFRFRWLSVGY